MRAPSLAARFGLGRLLPPPPPPPLVLLQRVWSKKRHLPAHSARRFASTRCDRITSLGNVFSEFTLLSNKHGSENLGQGFPSFGAPDFLTKGVEDLWAGDLYTTEVARHTLSHQYTTPGCEPELAEVLARKCSNSMERPISASQNVCTTVGAQEAIFNILTSTCDAGDEVVVLTPAYDAYFKAALLQDLTIKSIAMKYDSDRLDETGGQLDASHYYVDMDELERSITEKTRVLFLNSPSSPFGKVMTRAELEKIASVVRKHPDLVVVSDEVYEHMVFPGQGGGRHHHFASVEGMFEQTLSIYSVGKTFSCTGWRVGYAIGPEHLITPLKCIQAATSFGTSTPLQKLAAGAFSTAANNGYYDWLPAILGDKCRFLDGVVSRAGFKVIRPQGGYFFCADFTDVAERLGLLKDVPKSQQSAEFCRWMTTEIGVTPLPVGSFYGPPEAKVEGTDDGNETLVRFAFCKADRMLETAARNLLRLEAPGQTRDCSMIITATRNPGWIRYPNPNIPSWTRASV